jgi:hypothetical protein
MNRVKLGEYKQRLKAKHPTIVVLEYSNLCSKATFKCMVCNNTWECGAKYLLNRGRCFQCIPSKRVYKVHLGYTNKEFKIKLKEIFPNITPLEKYIGSKNKIKCECTVCEYKWSTEPATLLRGHGCGSCSGNKKTDKKYRIDLLEKGITKIVPQVKYAGAREKIPHKCLICKNAWNITPDNVLRGYGCPYCSQMKKTPKAHQKELDLLSLGIELVGKYKGFKKKTKYSCTECNFIWKSTPQAIKNKHSFCKKCYPDRKLGPKGNSNGAIKWLNIMIENGGYHIQHARNGGEKVFHIGKNRWYKTDGFDEKNKIIYEYLGDAYHGNDEIYNDNDKSWPFSEKTAKVLRKRTMRRLNDLIGRTRYTIVYVWENDFKNGELISGIIQT